MSFQAHAATRYYVAGHTGLIGSAFVRRLEADGCRNLITRSHAEMDLCDAQAVERFFAEEQPEVVVMAAGRVGGIIENRDNPVAFITDNLSMQLNTMQAAWRHGVKRFLFFASSCMYPRETEQPMREEQLLTGIPEATSIAYATAKMAGLQMCLAYNRESGNERFMPIIPNSVYGINDNFDLQSSHVLSALIRRFHEAKVQHDATITLWGSGTPRREFVFVDDVVDACLFLLRNSSLQIEYPVNIGTGVDYSIHELAHTIAGVVGYSGEILWDTEKPDGAPRKLLDSSKLLSANWRAAVDLEEGVQRTYQWFKQQYEAGHLA